MWYSLFGALKRTPHQMLSTYQSFDCGLVDVALSRLSVALIEGPVPRTPSRSDRQVSDEEMLPSCGSVAVAVKPIDEPPPTVVPSAGAVMCTVGLVAVGASRKMMSCGAPAPPSRETTSARSAESGFRPKS